MSKRKNRAYKRGQPYRDSRLYIIACEGEKTEKAYFEQFCKDFQRVEVVILPTTEDHKSAPLYVIGRADEYVRELGALGQDDKVWIVIDRDSWKEKNLGLVAQFCENKKKFELVLSNPCFEIWLVLHLDNELDLSINNQLNCQALKKFLRQALGSYNPANRKLKIS